MKTNPAPVSQARLQRVSLWAALWLAWAAEFVAGVAQRFRATRFLDAPHFAYLVGRVGGIVITLLLIEATLRAGPRARRALWSFGSSTEFRRALIGASLRRFLRTGTVAQRIARLAHLLKNREPIVARLVRRIQGGLTRTHRAAPATITRALRNGALIVCCADTS